MQWRGRRQSDNVEDRRGMSGGKMIAGGGVLGVIVLLVNFLLGGDGEQIIQLPQQQAQQTELSIQEQAADDERAGFVKVVLADTEDVWNNIFAKSGQTYAKPTLVLFRGMVESACGNASSASGPFYCSGDNKLYIDLSFYEDLQNKLNAPGDFAMAYVVAHEVGHHIQNLLGTSDKVHRLRSRLNETDFNKYSVMLELQADFYAGVWAHYAQQIKTAEGKSIIDANDISEALNAANSIGDDRLQKQAQGYVVPESFTHGTSEQRMYWFRKGFETGDVAQGDTFNAANLN